MSNTRARAPLVWILKGPKAGDYAQLQLLARALGVPAVTKQLVFSRWELLLHAWPRPTLAAVDRVASDSLEPPWPDFDIDRGAAQRTRCTLDSRSLRRAIATGARWAALVASGTF